MATETFSRVTNVLTFRDGERVRTLPSIKEQMLLEAERNRDALPSDCELGYPHGHHSYRAPDGDGA